MTTTYKEMSATTAFVIVQNKNGHKRYINGCYNPEIEITHHVDGAKHFDTYEQAQKELSDLELEKFSPLFTVEEHKWID